MKMNKKVIVVREAYDWIQEDDVGSAQYTALIRYIAEKYPKDDMLEQGYRRMRFINYVGVIVCSGVRYEIIPKVNLSKNDERNALMSMLSVTNFLPISFDERMKSRDGNNDLLSVFLSVFVKRLLAEFKKGIYRTYESKTDNLNLLKGSLALTQHIQVNAFQKSKAYCSFDEYTENNFLNQLLKAALMIVQKDTEMLASKLDLERCLGYLEYVEWRHFDRQSLKHIRFDRQTERFRDVIQFAKMIIEKASIYGSGRQSSSFSFLFPMNLLFEEYIGVALRHVVDSKKVVSQHAKKRLLRNKQSGRENILLKPDFVVDNPLILDTKWKSATYRGKTNYVQADIYQMYAYVTAYENVERCILLYPNQELEAVHPIWEVIDTDKTIEMHTVRIDDISKTIDALMEIIAHEYI